MSLRLNTGVMQYRESQNDVWKPMVIKTNLDWESLAEDYDATSDYEVGTYVLYNAELYRCTTAVPTGGEAWNAAHWIKVDFGSELNSLTEDVSELQEIAGDGTLSGFTATDLTGAANELKNTLTNNYRTASAQDTIDNTILGNLAMIESSPATQAHAIGDYVVYNGQLYKVTAAISAGESLTVGTNVEGTTVSGNISIFHEAVNIPISTTSDKFYSLSATRIGSIMQIEIVINPLTAGWHTNLIVTIDRKYFPKFRISNFTIMPTSRDDYGKSISFEMNPTDNGLSLTGYISANLANYVNVYFMYAI